MTAAAVATQPPVPTANVTGHANGSSARAKQPATAKLQLTICKTELSIVRVKKLKRVITSQAGKRHNRAEQLQQLQ